MTLYVDPSALLAIYLNQPSASTSEAHLLSDDRWVTARHSVVEVRRNLFRSLAGQKLTSAQRQFDVDWNRMAIVELNRTICDFAAAIAEMTGARTLDALHLAAARRTSADTVVTFDRRQADAARSLELEVLGV